MAPTTPLTTGAGTGRVGGGMLVGGQKQQGATAKPCGTTTDKVSIGFGGEVKCGICLSVCKTSHLGGEGKWQSRVMESCKS